jgi:hypothetical protein
VGFRERGWWGIGGIAFSRGIKGRGGRTFFGESMRVPIFQRKKTLEIRAILCFLGVQNAQNSLERALLGPF